MEMGTLKSITAIRATIELVFKGDWTKEEVKTELKRLNIKDLKWRVEK